MKETFKLFIGKEIEKYNSILSTNSLNEEDKAQVEQTIANLNEVATALDNETDEQAVEELRTSVNELNERLTAIMERISQTETNIEENENKMENYLSTKNSVADFLNCIRTSTNGADFSKNWRNVLSTNAVTIAEGSEFGYLPEYVKGMIQDLWDKKADWLSDLKIVNAKGYVVRTNTSDKNNANSRAKGWKPGDTKTEQSITLAAKKVVPQFIYKIQTIDAEMKFNADESLLDYLVEELVGQILYEEKRAILIGDGRESNATGKIDSIEAIYKGEDAVTDSYTTILTAEENSFMLDNLHNLVSQVKADGEEVIVFIAQSAINEATRVAASDTSTPLYLEDEQLARQIRASRIVVTDILDIAEITAIAMVPRKYVLVGENVLNPVLFNQHDIWTNTDVYRFECPVGGAVEGLKSTAVLKPFSE
jgi:HK97 family phage major capsid protein